MRTVKNLLGRMVGSLLGMVAKGPLDKAVGHTIEARLGA
jgi:hypothetical protein